MCSRRQSERERESKRRVGEEEKERETERERERENGQGCGYVRTTAHRICRAEMENEVERGERRRVSG